jgi:hypothetical protein
MTNNNKNSADNVALGKLIEFRPVAKTTKKSTTVDSTSIKLLKISDEIDALIMRHVEAGDVDLRELAGLLSHRLGTLVSHIEDKDALLPVCMSVMKRQAKVVE